MRGGAGISEMRNQLPHKLSDAQWKAFLCKAFPELQQDYARLDECLMAQHWAEAKQLAHKLKGIVELLEMNELIDDLVTINSQAFGQVEVERFLPVFKRHHQAYLADWCERFLPASA